jgi:hypothetical protein
MRIENHGQGCPLYWGINQSDVIQYYGHHQEDEFCKELFRMLTKFRKKLFETFSMTTPERDPHLLRF